MSVILNFYRLLPSDSLVFAFFAVQDLLLPLPFNGIDKRGHGSLIFKMFDLTEFLLSFLYIFTFFSLSRKVTISVFLCSM